MTNREWLQTLTDEGLAKLTFEICGMCAHNPEQGFCDNLSSIASFEKNYCIDGTVQWLQAEHKEK